MAKNSTKKAKFKPVSFKVRKVDFKKAIECILKHKSTTENYNRLNAVLFQTFKPDNLTMVATDGNSLLKVEIPVQGLTGEAKIILHGTRLSKFRIFKDFENKKRGFGLIDDLQITIFDDSITITDLANSVSYGIPEAFHKDFVGFEKLLTKNYDNLHKVYLNPALLARFSGLTNSKHQPCAVYIDTSDPNGQITIVNEFDCMKFTGLLMPCVKREE